MNVWNRTLLVAAVTMAAQATTHAALVETWTIDTSAKWISVTDSNGRSVDKSPVDVQSTGLTFTDQNITWGGEFVWQGRRQVFEPGSSLRITNPGLLSLDTTLMSDASASHVNSVALAHINMPIPGNAVDLTGASLNVSMLVKDASDEAASFLDLGDFTYDIKFVETDNSGRCAVASPTPCNDIFVLTSGSLAQTFEYADVTYFVEAFPINPGTLSVLSDRACREAGVAVGCVGFTTAENRTTTLQFGLSITAISFRDIVTDPLPEGPITDPDAPPSSPEANPVSEPAAWAVLGLAMLGAGIGRRRAKAQA